MKGRNSPFGFDQKLVYQTHGQFYSSPLVSIQGVSQVFWKWSVTFAQKQME
jgi:hypothetical protein